MWLLALLKGSTSVAAYKAAYKLYDTALLPATAIAAAAVELIMTWAVGGLAANIVGNVALVPVFGVPGAALAFLVTEAVLLIAFYATLPRPRPTAMGTASPVVAPAA